MYSEPYDELPSFERDLVRLIRSLIEELEAIEWYTQRMVATKDEEVRAVIKHNRDEEMEHAAMILELVRRRLPEFDKALKEYLFTNGSVTEIEKVPDEKILFTFKQL